MGDQPGKVGWSTAHFFGTSTACTIATHPHSSSSIGMHNLATSWFSSVFNSNILLDSKVFSKLGICINLDSYTCRHRHVSEYRFVDLEILMIMTVSVVNLISCTLLQAETCVAILTHCCAVCHGRDLEIVKSTPDVVNTTPWFP